MLNGILPPKILLGMLKKTIQKQIGHNISWYELQYLAENEELYFHLPKGEETKKILYEDSATISKMLCSLAAEKLNNNATIDILIIRYDENTDCTAKIFYTNNEGKKEFINHKL